MDGSTSQNAIDQMKSEFSKRINDAEKKIHLLQKEKNELKKQIENSHSASPATPNNSDPEKDKQIADLIEEGNLKIESNQAPTPQFLKIL